MDGSNLVLVNFGCSNMPGMNGNKTYETENIQEKVKPNKCRVKYKLCVHLLVLNLTLHHHPPREMFTTSLETQNALHIAYSLCSIKKLHNKSKFVFKFVVLLKHERGQPLLVKAWRFPATIHSKADLPSPEDAATTGFSKSQTDCSHLCRFVTLTNKLSIVTALSQ